ncbi:MAG: hypothetical protein WBP11_14765 [Dokdonella sp.]
MINPIRIALAAALFVSLAANAQTATSVPVATSGLHANGTAFNGLTFNGIRFNGLTFNGLTFNGLVFNGLVFNGLTFNGKYLNGKFLNGWSLNGRSLNGWMLNGRLHPNDGSTPPATAFVPFFSWKPVETEADWSALPVANVQVRLPAAP